MEKSAEQLAEELSDTQSQVSALAEQNAALLQRLEVLETAARTAHDQVQAEATAARQEAQAARQTALQTTMSNTPSFLKPLKPATFHGLYAEDTASWLFLCRQYFDACGMPSSQKVKFAAAFLRDNAATWWRMQVQHTDARGMELLTWEQFEQALQRQFERPNAKKVLRDRLFNLRQQRSVFEYVAKLREVTVQIPDLSEGEVLDKFIRGLKPAVRKELELRDPATLEEAIRMAERADSVEYRMRSAYAERSARYGPSNGPVPMELGALNNSSASQGAATLNRRDSKPKRDFSNVTCYVCGKKGHTSKICTQVRTGNAHRH